MYFFIAITPRSTLTYSGSIYRVLSMGQIDLFRFYTYSIEADAKKTLKKQVHKNINTNIQWTRFPNL